MVTLPAVQFWVAGVPQPQGSMTAQVRGGRAVMYSANAARLRPWRDAVTFQAREAWRAGAWQGVPLEGGVNLRLQFAFLRPASAAKRPVPHVKPDLDKLQRAVLDALTGVVYGDDAQVVSVTASKIYRPSGPGVLVAVGATETQLELPT